jgi:hypothetical protein
MASEFISFRWFWVLLPSKVPEGRQKLKWFDDLASPRVPITFQSMLLSGIKKSTLLDYPGKVATIVFTMGCNMRCGYCHNSEFVLPEKMKEICHDCISEDVFFRFLKTRTGFLDGVVVC